MYMYVKSEILAIDLDESRSEWTRHFQLGLAKMFRNVFRTH